MWQTLIQPFEYFPLHNTFILPNLHLHDVDNDI